MCPTIVFHTERQRAVIESDSDSEVKYEEEKVKASIFFFRCDVEFGSIQQTTTERCVSFLHVFSAVLEDLLRSHQQLAVLTCSYAYFLCLKWLMNGIS